jgi:uncharacterized protein YjbI with pentapeptide repeats
LSRYNFAEADLSAANLNGAKLYVISIPKNDPKNILNLPSNWQVSGEFKAANLTEAKLCHTIMPDGKENNRDCLK